MNTKLPLLIASALVLSVVSTADAKLQVVATLADLAAVATQIGGPHVEVTALAKPTEDAHFVDARPSFVVKLRSADVLIEGGADLEIGWLPSLLQNARNEKIAAGAPGRVVASQGIRLLNVPESASRAAGDVHVMGNPHFMIDPIIAKAVAQHIAQAFRTLDPANAADYDASAGAFVTTVDARLQEWGKAMLPFKGANVVAYHDSWPYLAHRFGVTIDTFLEPKPGIPPPPSHLAEVIARMKEQHTRAILVEPFHNRKIAEKVAAETGATVVDVAQYPGALPDTGTYVALIDTIIARLTAALGGQ